MASLTQLLSGRKRESGIWKYFTYKADKDRSQCTVLAEKGSACGHEVSGKKVSDSQSQPHVSLISAKGFKYLASKLSAQQDTALSASGGSTDSAQSD